MTGPQRDMAIVGCGFVADLYMASLRRHPGLRVVAATDRDPLRRERFGRHWSVPVTAGLEELFRRLPQGGIVLNLTNPGDHAGVTRAALDCGYHVWSEKPMTTDLAAAVALHDLARRRGLHLASAPSSVLSETAQTLFRAIRDGVAGAPRLVYAELDDGFIPQAPFDDWISESGAPWPWADEFRVGCTQEHAGYWLGWLIAAFGPVATVTADGGTVIPVKNGLTGTAPDVTVALLTFAGGGPVARLTCSIAAPHNHHLRIIGDAGILEVPEAWDNSAPVRFRRRFRLRRRLVEHPIGRRIRLPGPTHPKVPRTGAAAMNFALGPAEMAEAIAAGRAPRLAGDYALHLTEVTLAIEAALAEGRRLAMTTTCRPPEPMPWAR